jgi:hypothetical protein
MAIQYGKQVRDIGELVSVFEAQEGLIIQIIGKTGNGKTYEATRQAWNLLKQGKVVYTTWHLILPEYYDERQDKLKLFWSLLTFNKKFYRFDFKKNWKHLDIDRPDLVEYVANLTDCYVFLDEGQDIFDSYEGRAMSQTKRKSLTRTRHLRKTLIIISQRASAVAVTARANVTWFYKCVKTWVWYMPWRNFFKVYMTEEMDDQSNPIWEKPMEQWTASVFHQGFEDKRIYNLYNSWYLREGIVPSQEVNFDAYNLTTMDKIKALFSKKEKVPLAFTYEEMVEKSREKQAQYRLENEILNLEKTKEKKALERKAKKLTKEVEEVEESVIIQ